eukprot:TRINITY_DN2089_c0_g1_i2.p1 TRINITY_DN2089_c0_g1~~TRINITY_DN2089_c0_g1_i2.p1  ORF type:complete len:229 (-),score=59.23 TRINITY_DN2089_c0_g1_i2:278-964(-)
MSAKKIGSLGKSECSVCLESWTGSKIDMLQCGHSLHSKCLKGITRCPMCNTKIEHSARNYNLEELANDDLELYPSIEFILFDVSSSMRWSDTFPWFAGTSRIQVAKMFSEVIIMDRIRSNQDKLGFYSFDENKLNLVDYNSGKKRGEYIAALEGLEPKGLQTKLFGSLLECLNDLQSIKTKTRERRLIVITDGKDTFSNKKHVEELSEVIKSFGEKKLHLKSFLVQKK